MNPEKDQTAKTSWPPANATLDEVQEAFSQAHSAVQWLARMVNSFSVPASDGSHLHMRWHADDAIIETATFAENTSVEMRLPGMVLQFLESGSRTKHEVELDDKSPAQIEAWTLIELLHRGIDRDAYSKHLPYDVSHLLGGDAQDYQTFGREQAFADMTAWMRHAAKLLETISTHAKNNKLGETSNIRFAPETFSLFTRIHPEGERPAVGSFVEIGFCGGTAPSQDPHFYAVTPHGAERTTVSLKDVSNRSLSEADIAAKLAIENLLKDLSAR